MSEVLHIRSRDNPTLKSLRRMARDNTGYRSEGRVWVEGEHLVAAALRSKVEPEQLVYSEEAWELRGQASAMPEIPTVILSSRLFAELSQLGSPSGQGIVLRPELEPTLRAGQSCVVLDRIQDAGNVGSILRSASAFGFKQVLALQGTAALWGSKVLRAGMGAHFSLRLIESVPLDTLREMNLPLLSTDPHRGELIASARLPWPCVWIFGHEGQGVSEPLQALASQTFRIEQPGGEESLNVAACAAICLHASSAAASQGLR